MRHGRAADFMCLASFQGRMVQALARSGHRTKRSLPVRSDLSRAENPSRAPSDKFLRHGPSSCVMDMEPAVRVRLSSIIVMPGKSLALDRLGCAAVLADQSEENLLA
jgi:hypothetical protein